MKIEEVILREIVNFVLNPRDCHRGLLILEHGEVNKFITWVYHQWGNIVLKLSLHKKNSYTTAF